MEHSTASDRPAPIWRRLLWFAALWASSILALGVVAMILKMVLKVA